MLCIWFRSRIVPAGSLCSRCTGFVCMLGRRGLGLGCCRRFCRSSLVGRRGCSIFVLVGMRGLGLLLRILAIGFLFLRRQCRGRCIASLVRRRHCMLRCSFEVFRHSIRIGLLRGCIVCLGCIGSRLCSRLVAGLGIVLCRLPSCIRLLRGSFVVVRMCCRLGILCMCLLGLLLRILCLLGCIRSLALCRTVLCFPVACIFGLRGMTECCHSRSSRFVGCMFCRFLSGLGLRIGCLQGCRLRGTTGPGIVPGLRCRLTMG